MVRARTHISIFDILICLIAISISLLYLFFPFGSSEKHVHIKAENYDSYLDLSENTSFDISSSGYKFTVEIKDGAVRIKDSNCPDKLCVSSGWVKDGSKPIVCAPAKAVIRIEADGGDSDADIIAGR